VSKNNKPAFEYRKWHIEALCALWAKSCCRSRSDITHALDRWRGKCQEMAEQIRINGNTYDVPDRLVIEHYESKRYALDRFRSFAYDLDFDGFVKPLEGLLALPIRKPLEPGEWRRFEKIWGPRQSDQTTVEFGPARAVLGEYVAAAAPQDIKATFDVPSKGVPDLISYCRDLTLAHKTHLELSEHNE